jgi:hypothetical protein
MTLPYHRKRSAIFQWGFSRMTGWGESLRIASYLHRLDNYLKSFPSRDDGKQDLSLQLLRGRILWGIQVKLNGEAAGFVTAFSYPAG